MNAPFRHTAAPEPHPARRKAILAAHPEMRALNGRAPVTALVALALVAFQLGLAALVGWLDLPWWAALALAWGVGAFVAHALIAVIHEFSHRLVLPGWIPNRLGLLFANLPLLMPFAVPLAHHHLVHHRAQGELGADPDLPAAWEVRWLDHSWLGRLAWNTVFPFVQLGRKSAGTLKWSNPWMIANIAVQAAVAIAVVAVLGWLPLLYLGASLYFVLALHPLTGRFVQEHFLLGDDQETTSYYGALNLVALNFGMHVEHHDFPGVPWTRLPRVRRIAPSFYLNRRSERSWAWLWLRLLFDPSVRIADRLVRSPDQSAGTDETVHREATKDAKGREGRVAAKRARQAAETVG